MRRYRLGDHGLSKVLFMLFVLSWLGQLVTEYFHEAQQAVEHGQERLGFWSTDFWLAFGQSTFENWQSEFLQILCFVLLTVHLVHRGSHESRDGEDEMKDQLDRIEQQVAALHERYGQ